MKKIIVPLPFSDANCGKDAALQMARRMERIAMSYTNGSASKFAAYAAVGHAIRLAYDLGEATKDTKSALFGIEA